MRIVGGTHRGRALSAVGKGDAAAHLRPTGDRVRESLFNILAHRDVVEGAQVLDVFAGTGALGFEALSRGAVQATFIDDGRVAAEMIRKNAILLQKSAQITLIRRDVRKLAPHDGAPFDLVFLDPPYGKGLGGQVLTRLARGRWIAPMATIILEDGVDVPAPDGFAVLDRRRFGQTHITMLALDESPLTVAQ
ncbi:MAG: 16S rRNA (guanine(966)-N(2))-methyltransferase RsmD [Rhodobacteraceae bacterium]|nr:16S rRNA (guanine(966)-N(2))-methyltransferase RsmD [Paracoccaceae bacterium]